MKSKRSSSNFYYTWWIYVLIAAAVIVFWLWIFDYLAEPAANEKLFISVVGNGVDDKTMNSDLKNELPNLTNQTIKEVSVESIVYESDYTLSNALWARSLDVDIIIITNTAMFNSIGKDYFPAIDEDRAKAIFGDVEFYKEDGVAYGMLIYDGKTENTFSKYYSKEKCWVFFTVDGQNTGRLNGKGNAHDDAAIQTVKWLLS